MAVMHAGIEFVANSLRWDPDDERPSGGVIAVEVKLADLTLPAGSRVELSQPEHGTRQTIFTADLVESLVIAGFEVPGRSQLEFDDLGRLTGVILGAAIAVGPSDGLSYDRGAYIGYIADRWAFCVDDALGR